MLFWVFLAVLILLILFFAIPPILRFVDIRTELFRRFTKKNDGFFSVFFIILFAAEQATLIILLFIFENDTSLVRLIVSVFGLFVVTTAALQRFVLETKRRYEKEQYDTALKAKGVLKEISERLSEKSKTK